VAAIVSAVAWSKLGTVAQLRAEQRKSAMIKSSVGKSWERRVKAGKREPTTASCICVTLGALPKSEFKLLNDVSYVI